MTDVPSMPPDMTSDVLMPPDANIPYESQIASEADHIRMIVPSW